MNPIDSTLEPFETTAGFTKTVVADALRKIEDSVAPAERPRWWAESSAAMFREIEDRKSQWGTAFGPVAVLKNDAGDEMAI